MRLLLLATWGVYPIAYLFPVLGVSGASAMIGLQVGYSIADITAKAGYGLMIYGIAKSKSEAEGYEGAADAHAARPVAA
jgi:bacteriorhodopsin